MILGIFLLADVLKVTKLTHSKQHIGLTKAIENLGWAKVFDFKVEKKILSKHSAAQADN